MPNSSNASFASNLEALAEALTGKVEIPAGGGPVPFPAEASEYVRFKASPDNMGRCFLHGAGSADGWPLDAGQETGYAPAASLDAYEARGAAGDVIYYELLR